MIPELGPSGVENLYESQNLKEYIMEEKFPLKIYSVISEEIFESDCSTKKTPLYIGEDLETAKKVMSQEIRKYKERLVADEHINLNDLVESWKEEEYQAFYKVFTSEGKHFWYGVTLTENRPV